MNNIHKRKSIIRIKFTIIILAVFFLQNTNGFAQGITINDDGTDANTSAILDVKINAGTQGFLLPRMTEVQKDAVTTRKVTVF